MSPSLTPPPTPLSQGQADRGFGGLLGVMVWMIPWAVMVPPGCRYIEMSYSGPTQMAWGTVIVVSLLVISQRYATFRALLPRINPWMIAFLAWCLLSAFWSPYRNLAMKQAILISAASLFAIAFVLASWDAGRLHRVLIPALVTLVVCSMIVALVDPAKGVEPGDQFELRDSWRGLTFQKNTLGQLAAITLIFLVHATITRLLNPMFTLVAIGITLFVLLKSRSSTSLMLSCAASGLIMLQCRPLLGGRSRKLILMPAVGLLVFPLIAYFVLGGLGRGGSISRIISGAFGKDITFSGRTEIWELVAIEIAQHPWRGIGYGSFWHGYSSPSEYIIRHFEWDPHSAHNGYLEIINAVGYIGFALFIAFAWRHWRDTYRLMQIDRAQGSLHMSYFVYALFANLSESQWFNVGSIVHIVAMLSSLMVTRMLFQHDLSVAARWRAERARRLARLEAQNAGSPRLQPPVRPPGRT